MTYQSLSECLAAHGVTAQLIRPGQLVISAQRGPVWPDRGNSFWVHQHEDVWYICTWTPRAYRLPADQDILSLCLDCMAQGDTAMYHVPSELIAKYQLAELSDVETGELLDRDS